MERIKNIPVPLLPTMVGAMTLSNAYAGIGYTFIRHLTMIAGLCVLGIYCVKIVKYFPTVRKEYENTVLASLYSGFTMIMMLGGSYLFELQPLIGRSLWFAGIVLHSFHILVFTYRYVIKKRALETFVPSYFVTYNGIMVAIVVGGTMDARQLLWFYTYYGICVYLVLIVLLIRRLLVYELNPTFLHTLGIVLAPCALSLTSYLNMSKNPDPFLVYFLFGCVLVSLVFIILMLPKFFKVAFGPGYAGLTFPMAIGLVSTTKVIGYLSSQGYNRAAAVVTQISGIQLYLTSMLVGYVVLNFIIMALPRKE